jgi:acetyl-CoA carboxylase carboxyltransferase component
MKEDLIQQIQNARTRAMNVSRPDGPGKLHARERLSQLLDSDSFVEYGVLAGATPSAEDASSADGLVSGAGKICGKPVVAASYDTTVLNGTQSEKNQRKLGRLIYLANRHRWPLIVFVDGDGARQGDPQPGPPIIIAPRGRWDVYDGLAQLSGWAPTVAVVSGRALDGHAGIAMLSDFVVATRDATFGSWQSSGAEPVERPVEDYAGIGSLDLLVDDESAAIDAVKRYLSYYLQDHPTGEPSTTHHKIATIIPDNRRRPYDMRNIITAFADGDSVFELGAAWGPSMLTVLARLKGRSVGIFANQPKSPVAGAINADAADKAARFIELCDAYELPLISFIDNPGYMVGPEAEREGMARHHARPLAALHHRTVPLCSVQIRKAYGLGPYSMSGWGSARSVPELRLAWPTVESGGMSLEGAASLVKRKEILAAESKKEAMSIRNEYAEKMRERTSGLSAGRNFTFDDIIHPEETRDRISAILERIPRAFGSEKKHPIDSR